MADQQKNAALAEQGMGSGIPCCPELKTESVCDALEFHYRLVHPTSVTHNNRRVEVEVLIRVRFERCPGPLALGDPVYTTTLFPGERVQLFTADRRTRFTFDSSSQLSYRHEQTAEEQYYLSSVNDFMSDIETRDSQGGGTTSKGSSEGRASTSSALETIFGGASVSVSGSYNAESTWDFMRELHQHAKSSHHRSEEATRIASSISIGEVNTRSHAEGETHDHFESSSRTFSNPNHCHAITYYFYRINRLQTIRFTIESIERRVIDPAADARVQSRPFTSAGGVQPIPAGVLATAADRLEVEERGRQAARMAEQAPNPQVVGAAAVATRLRTNVRTVELEPMPEAVRQKALAEVDAGLVAARLIARPGGAVTEIAKRQFSFEVQSALPTPGLFVRGCLDECSICEEAVQEEIRLDLEHKRLQNKLLERQIELLEKSQEYRCCPDGGDEDA